MPRTLKILLVDEASYRRLLGGELKQAYGHEIEEAGGYEEAVQLFEQAPASFDLAIIDYSLEGERSGVELLHRLHQTEPNLPVIIITGVGDRKISQEALRAGAFWYLDKPHDWVELEMLLKWVGRYHATSQLVNPQSVWGANLWMHVSDAIVSAQTIPELVEAVRSKALALLEAERCGILEVDPEKGSISGWSTAEGEEQDLLNQIFSPLASDMESLEKPILAPLTETDAGPPPHPHYRAWSACACPPAKGATEILFALFEKDLSEEQKLGLALKLVTLARLIGVALENLRKANLLQALVDSGRELLTVRESDGVYRILVKQIVENLNVRTFYLALHRRSTDTIHFPFFYHQGEEIGDRKPILSRREVREDQSFTVYVLNRNEELTIEDVNNHPYPTKPYFIEDISAKAYFAVPLHRPDGSVFGVLSIQSAVPRKFPDPLKQAVRGLAGLLAPTLSRLRRTRLQERILKELMNGTPQSFLEESLRSVWESANADLVSFYPYDPKRNTFRLDQVISSPNRADVPAPSEDEIPTLLGLLAQGYHFTKDLASDYIFGPQWTERYGSRSIAGIVLKPSGSSSFAGVVIIHYTDCRTPDDEFKTDIYLFSPFAAVASHLIEQQDRQKHAEQRRQLLETLFDVSDSQSLAQILEEVIPRIWPAHLECRLLLAHRGERQLYSPIRSDVPRVEFGKRLVGKVAQSGQTLWAYGPRALQDAEPFSQEAKSALCVPVKLGGSLLGVISLESDEETAFEEEDRLFMEQVSKSAAATLVAASRKEASKMVTDAARSALLDPERGLEIVAESVHNIVTSVGGAPTSTTVFLVTGKELQLAWAWPKEQWERLWKKVGTLTLEEAPGRKLGIVARAAREGRTKYVPDVSKEKDYIDFDPDTLAELAVPVLTGTSVVGVINLEYSRPGDLGSVQESLVESLAEQTEIIMILQNQARELSLQRRNLAEEEKKKAIAATLAFVGLDAADHAHRLTNLEKALEGALGRARQLRRDRISPCLPNRSLDDSTEADARLADFEEIVSYLLNEIREEPDTERDPEQVERILLAEWARELTSTWHARSLLDVRIDIDEFTGILASRYWLNRGIYNILDNAKNSFLEKIDDIPKIAFSIEKNDQLIRITVQDNGPGVDPEIAPLLFRTRIPGDRRHGLGCLLTSFIVYFYGGTIILPIESTSFGTRITIEFNADA
jgi:putative methionine-R-sulfoxide reductase with GAF domain/CheY-like chemotaxis protein